MKIYLSLVMLCFINSFLACSRTNRGGQQDVKAEEGSAAISSRTTETPIYWLNVETTSSCEVYVNDILVAKNKEGSLEIFEMINDLILKSGKQHIRLVFPGKANLTKLDLRVSNSIEDTSYQTYKEYSGEKLNVVEWEVDIQVPYTHIGWSESEDLSIRDEVELRKMVLDYYMHIKDAIDSGDAESYFKNYATAEKELNGSFYLSDQEILQEKQENRLRIADSKGKTKLLGTYQMKFYANGRIVCLQDEDGNSPILSERTDLTSYFGFFLHIPKGKSKLEIIR